MFRKFSKKSFLSVAVFAWILMSGMVLCPYYLCALAQTEVATPSCHAKQDSAPSKTHHDGKPCCEGGLILLQSDLAKIVNAQHFFFALISIDDVMSLFSPKNFAVTYYHSNAPNRNIAKSPLYLQKHVFLI